MEVSDMKRVLTIAILIALCCSLASAQIKIAPNATDQSTTINIINPATGAAYTGLTVTGFDLYYHVAGAVLSDKVDATAGSATAHSDNTVVEIGKGLYEIDWPDAIWAGRTAGTVIELVVEWDTVNHYVVAQQVQIETPQTGDAYTPALAAQTAAEKIDTNSELRTLLTGENKAVAKQETLENTTYGLDAILDAILAIAARLRY